MPRAFQPHTPEIDLEARRAHSGASGQPPVLTPELEAFCQSGISVIIAAGGPGVMPVAGVGRACRMLPDGRMRLLLPRSGNEGLIAAAQCGGHIAATFSRPVTHRSIQVKASRASISMPTEKDRKEAARQSAGLLAELIEIGETPAFSAAYCHVDPDDIVAIDITLESAFVQTPGPGAGAELKP